MELNLKKKNQSHFSSSTKQNRKTPKTFSSGMFLEDVSLAAT